MEQAYRVNPSNASTSVSTNQPELSVIENVQAQIWGGIEQQVKGMVRTLVEEALAAEAGAQVTAAPYERTDERTGYRNGSYRRDLMTRYGPIEDLRVPRVQLLDGSTPPAYQTFDRWERRTPDLERAIGQMFVLGISTRKLRSLCDELWGAPVSSATVSRVTQALDYDVDAFLSRAIEDDIEYLYLDGITAKLRQLGVEGSDRIRPSSFGEIVEGHAAGHHDNYGFALAAHPGESQGRPLTNTSSQLTVRIGLPVLTCSQRPCPGWSHHTQPIPAGRRQRAPAISYRIRIQSSERSGR